MLTFSRNYYELLGVAPSSDGEALRKAFRKRSKELHPDTTSLPKDEAADKFQQVCEAYELLADPNSRRIYDLELAKINLLNEELKLRTNTFIKNSSNNKSAIGERRPFSGGELFSLLLLGMTLLVSLILGVAFAMAQGKELMIRPTWLLVCQFLNNYFY